MVEEEQGTAAGFGIPGKYWCGQLVQRDAEEKVQKKPV